MIKLEYVLEGNSGELELQGLSNYESKNDILSSIETSDIEFTIIEDALKILKPDLDTAPALLRKSNELNQNLTIRSGTFIH
jgi:hypothetical protein